VEKQMPMEISMPFLQTTEHFQDGNWHILPEPTKLSITFNSTTSQDNNSLSFSDFHEA